MKQTGLRWKKLLLIILISVLLAVLYNLIVSIGYLPSFFYVQIESQDIRGLIYCIWQVQVTITLISITLTTLIINKLDYMIYGQYIRDILNIKSRCGLNYIEKIIYVIILSIVEVFFIIYSNMASVIFLFFITSYTIVKLLIDSYNILFYSKRYEEYTLDYINKYFNREIESEDIKNCIKIINDIKTHNLKMIKDNDITNLQQNLEFLISKFADLYKCEEFKRNYNEVGSHLQKAINETTKYLINGGYLYEVIDLIRRIADNRIKYKYKKNVVEDLIGILVNKCEDIDNENDIDKVMKFVIADIFIDTDVLKFYEELGISPKGYLSVAQFKCFRNIYINEHISMYTKSNLIDNYIYRLMPSEYENVESQEYFIRKTAIYYISKYIIDSNDRDSFVKILSYIQNNNAFSLNLKEKVEIFEIIITLSIYIYYCVAVENAFSLDKKNDIIEFASIKNNDGTIHYKSLKEFITSIGINIWDYYKTIKSEMPKNEWEKMFIGEVKTILIPKTIEEFYIFYSIAFIEDYDLDMLENKITELNICKRILETIDLQGSIQDSKVKERFDKFVNIFAIHITYEELIGRIKKIHKCINRIYIKLLIEKQKEYYRSEDVTKNENKIMEDIVSGLKNNNLYRLTNENIMIGASELAFDLQPLDTSILADKVYLIGPTFQKKVVDSIEKSIVESIANKSIKYTYSLTESKKIDALIGLIDNCLSEFKCIINGRLSDNFALTYNESQDKVELLQDVDKKIVSFYNLGSEKEKVKILLSKDDIDIKVQITQLEIKNIKDSQIRDLISNLKQVDGYYEFPIQDNINLFFTEIEIIEYLSFKYKIAYIKFKLSVDCKDVDIISVIQE